MSATAAILTYHPLRDFRDIAILQKHGFVTQIMQSPLKEARLHVDLLVCSRERSWIRAPIWANRRVFLGSPGEITQCEQDLCDHITEDLFFQHYQIPQTRYSMDLRQGKNWCPPRLRQARIQEDDQDAGSLNELDDCERWLRYPRAHFLKAVMTQYRPDSVLVYGCTGELSIIRQSNPKKITLVNINPHYVDRLRQQNIDAEVGWAERHILRSPIYDLLVCFETIEHIPCADRFLWFALRHARHIALTTPDFFGAYGIQAQHFIGWDPSHVHIWSAETLTKQINTYGGRVTFCQANPQDSLIWLVAKGTPN